MKKMKTVALLLALALVLLAGCGQGNAPAPSSGAPESSQAAPSQAPEKTLLEQGQELVALMGEMANNSQYASFYTDDQEMQELLAAAGEGDFSSPQAVYAIRFPDEALAGLLELAGLGSLDGFSDELRQNLRARVISAMPTQLNAMGGSSVLAAASICTASKTFVNGQAAENLIYLYTYPNAVPVAVTFLPGEDGAVSATGMFILYEQGQSMGPEQFQSLLGSFGVEIEEVTQ